MRAGSRSSRRNGTGRTVELAKDLKGASADGVAVAVHGVKIRPTISERSQPEWIKCAIKNMGL